MPHLFPLERSSLAFLTQAPFKLQNEALLPASPEKVWEELTTGDWRAWFKDLVGVTWTSPEPHGVGSTRDVHLKTLSVQERFLAYDQASRYAFSVDAITLPLVKAMVEDMQLMPEGPDQTRFRWTVYYSPTLLMRAIHPVGRFIFNRMFQQSLQGLARVVSSR